MFVEELTRELMAEYMEMDCRPWEWTSGDYVRYYQQRAWLQYNEEVEPQYQLSWDFFERDRETKNACACNALDVHYGMIEDAIAAGLHVPDFNLLDYWEGRLAMPYNDNRKDSLID